MELKLQARMLQEMRLAPQMIQSMEILQLPAMELQKRVQQELQENPVLELTAPEGEPVAETPADTAAEADRKAEEDFSEILEWEADWIDHLRQTRRPRPAGGDRDPKLDALNNTADDPESLQEMLAQQIRFLDLSEREQTIAEEIIYNIDDRGYLQFPLPQVIEGMNSPPTLDRAEQVLRIVQGLEPAGVGARDLRECLLLQLRAKHTDLNGDGDLVRDLIINYLDDLENNRYPKVAKETGRSIDELKDAVSVIATLNPKPGARFGGRKSQYIMPDVIVESIDGEYEIRLINDYTRDIGISGFYREQFEKAKNNPEVRAYLKKKIESARWLIDAIQQRQHTLERVTHSVFRHQRGFLDKGIDQLSPLKMQAVADEVGVHVSTVSRAISEKYAQTPRGIFPLRFFFTGGTTGADGEGEAWEAVRRKVKEIVDAEDKQKPLSDGDIAERLKEQGLDIARRTVTKYRKQLGIPSSRKRKEF